MVENTKCVFARIVIGIMHDGIRHFKYEPREHNARRRTYLANYVDERQCFCQSFMLFAFDCRNRHRAVANDSGNVEEKVEIDLAFALSSTENDIDDAYGRIRRIAFRFTDHDRLHFNLRLFDFSTRISA